MIEIIIDNKKITPYGWTFKVTVHDDIGETKHSVTVAEDYYKKLTQGKITPEELIKNSFEYLLSREPKESIFGQFVLPTLHQYFPDYETSMRFKSAD